MRGHVAGQRYSDQATFLSSISSIILGSSYVKKHASREKMELNLVPTTNSKVDITPLWNLPAG